ncbi:hypothetical protein C8R46DRAFT_1038906 [Mycena filopes]|nr:hypothetical protein C8R46DRAFT_1038906 [Mycena filopes]
MYLRSLPSFLKILEVNFRTSIECELFRTPHKRQISTDWREDELTLSGAFLTMSLAFKQGKVHGVLIVNWQTQEYLFFFLVGRVFPWAVILPNDIIISTSEPFGKNVALLAYSLPSLAAHWRPLKAWHPRTMSHSALGFDLGRIQQGHSRIVPARIEFPGAGLDWSASSGLHLDRYNTDIVQLELRECPLRRGTHILTLIVRSPQHDSLLITYRISTSPAVTFSLVSAIPAFSYSGNKKNGWTLTLSQRPPKHRLVKIRQTALGEGIEASTNISTEKRRLPSLQRGLESNERFLHRSVEIVDNWEQLRTFPLHAWNFWDPDWISPAGDAKIQGWVEYQY